jgi:5-methylcytosine-specific restriction endonuclease McrA
MAIEPIVFTEDELSLIGTVINRGDGWDSPDLDPIRSRIKQFYLAGQTFRCCYCRRQNVVVHGRAWDVEHVISRATNATFMFEPQNLAVACLDCNLAKLNADVLVRKRSRFPRTSGAYKIVHPHFDDWDEHFLFGNVVYTPLTAKAAETLKVCKLYRFYKLIGKDALFAHDRRYLELAEGVLFAKTPGAAEPAVLAMRALIQEAKEES